MRADSVRGAVLAARRRWLLARWAESGLLGLGVAGASLAAASLSGAAPLSRGALQAAALCAVLAALTLAVERRRSPQEFARRLDDRLGEGGALLTAFECESRDAGGDLAGLLVRGVVARLAPARLAATRTPLSPAFVALALLGATLAALAVDRAPAEPGGPTAAGRARAVLGRIAELAQDPRALDHLDQDALARALQDLERLGDADLAAAPQVGAAAAALEVLVAPAEPRPSSSGRLDARTDALAQAALDRLRRGVGTPAGGAGRGPEPAGRGSDEPALAGAAPGRTMSGSPEEPALPPTPAPIPAAPGDPALAPAPAGRWWSRRHDAVIAAYVERTRAALEARQAGQR